MRLEKCRLTYVDTVTSKDGATNVRTFKVRPVRPYCYSQFAFISRKGQVSKYYFKVQLQEFRSQEISALENLAPSAFGVCLCLFVFSVHCSLFVDATYYHPESKCDNN